MKVALETRDTGTIGAKDSTKFTILASAKAFRTLMDGMSSDKIIIPIRELRCNAIDAHVIAGTTTTPFDFQHANHNHKQLRNTHYNNF
mgnify:CR=1 FL=1